MLELRPYQTAALEAIDKAEAEGIRRPLVAHATGLGKTVMFAHLIAERQPCRALVLAHRDELIGQAVDKLRIIAPELKVGIIKAELDERYSPVVVASVQSLHAKRLATFRAGDRFETIVVDEAHHAAAPTYMRILEHFGSFEDDGPLTLGVTATPERGDGLNLGVVWQQVVHEMSILRGIVEGWLVDVRAQVVGTDADLSKVKVHHGDFAEAALGEELERSGALAQIAGAYAHYAPHRIGLAFTPTVRSAHVLARELFFKGITAEALDGTTPLDDRRAILRRLRLGETQVVVNCGVLVEGFDETRIDCVLIARPTRSRPLFVQMIGRGTRLDPRKKDLLVLDVTGASTRHDLVSVATLAGVRNMKGKTLVEAAIEKEAQEREEGERTLELARQTKAADLFRSKMRWLSVEGGFVLPTGNTSTILIPVDDGTWDVALVAGTKVTVEHERLPLGYAQGIGEDDARRNGGSLSLRDAYWLSKTPTANQLGRLTRYGLKDPSRVKTRGQAADLITRVQARRAIRHLKGRRS